MSTYTKMTKNPTTGKWEEALWLDDHFGPHQYGVKFPNDLIKDIVNPEKVKLETRDYTAEETIPMLESQIADLTEELTLYKMRVAEGEGKLEQAQKAWAELQAALNLD